MSRESIKTLKYKVKQALELDESTRNSDIRLTNYIWVNFYGEYIHEDENRKMFVKLLDLYNLPKQSSITRIRETFNQKGLYLPTDPEVRRKRNQAEEDWRGALGYNPELRECYV
jgi:hypothetical protein